MPNTVSEICDRECWSYLAVMRVSFSMVVYHALLALLTLGIRNTQDWRASIHNGYWAIKMIAWLSLLIGTFYIDDTAFYNYWVAAIIFSALFILHQAFLLVDFAWSWAQKWIDLWEETGENFYRNWLLIFCGAFYTTTLVGSILMMIYFGPPAKADCGLNTYFVVLNLLLLIVHSVVAILPRIQESTPKSGIFQSSILGIYTTYLITSAIASEPSDDGFNCGLTDNNSQENLSGTMVYVGLAVTFLALAYSAFASGSSTSLFEPLSTDEEAEFGDEREDDEQERTSYNYSFFHASFVMAAFYMAMVLTDWRIMESNLLAPNGVSIVHGFGAMWVKVATSWVCVLLYIWTLVAPLVFPDRNFAV